MPLAPSAEGPAGVALLQGLRATGLNTDAPGSFRAGM
jgi:hypothetical protein